MYVAYKTGWTRIRAKFRIEIFAIKREIFFTYFFIGREA